MTNASSLGNRAATAWRAGLGEASSSSAWLSSDWLLSRKAIPLYVLVGIWLVQRLPSLLERFFTPRATYGTAAWVVPAETRHARFLPVESKHAFRYNTLYLALRLDQLETRKLDAGHAFAWKGPVLEPEFVDHAALADRRGVTPAGHSHDSAPHTDTADAVDQKTEWKAKMRAAERIERRRLEEKRARNDRYTWSLTGLRPSSYLRTQIPLAASAPNTPAAESDTAKAAWISGSVLLKLAYELRQRGFLSVGPQDSETTGAHWRSELGHVWTVTMPSVAGITGINPLTVHYCYRPHGFGDETHRSSLRATTDDKRGEFWLVVLEVHNTFSERHIYVLEAGTNEDGAEVLQAAQSSSTAKRGGCDHQWTFPRSFHVSPFNDRGGYYRLFLKEPFAADADASSQAEPQTFALGIRLLLLVEEENSAGNDHGPSSPRLVKKLMATLDSIAPAPASAKGGADAARRTGRRVRPLSSATLYAALMRQPVDLFLTFARILWQAGKLHFAKRLDAFGRPDMVQLSEAVGADADAYDGTGLPPPHNRIEPHRKANGGSDASGGLVYPEPGWAETVAKSYVHALVERRVHELEQQGEAWSVTIRSTDPADPGIAVASSKSGCTQRTLVLSTRSYGVYVDLMLYTPSRLALLVGSIAGRRWGVSSIDAFDAFFAAQQPLNLQRVRARHLNFILDSHRAASGADREQTLQTLRAFGITIAAAGPHEAQPWSVRVAIASSHFAAVAEKKAFALLGARYVAGTEPWLELSRGVAYVASLKARQHAPVDKASWDTRLGSVRRT